MFWMIQKCEKYIKILEYSNLYLKIILISYRNKSQMLFYFIETSIEISLRGNWILTLQLALKKITVSSSFARLTAAAAG